MSSGPFRSKIKVISITDMNQRNWAYNFLLFLVCESRIDKEIVRSLKAQLDSDDEAAWFMAYTVLNNRYERPPDLSMVEIRGMQTYSREATAVKAALGCLGDEECRRLIHQLTENQEYTLSQKPKPWPQ